MNIGSIKYIPELNQINIYNNKSRIFLDNLSVDIIRKNLERLIEEVVPEGEWEDVHLGTFLSTFGGIRCIMPYWDWDEDLTLINFPTKGKIKEYRLNKKYDFLSNIHQNPDPIIIRGILDAVPLHPTKREMRVWLPGWGIGAPNQITGTVLFKMNPFEPITKYPGFEELMNPPKD